MLKTNRFVTLTAGCVFATVSALALASCGSGGSGGGFFSEEQHAEDIRPVTQIELAKATTTPEGDETLPTPKDLRADDKADVTTQSIVKLADEKSLEDQSEAVAEAHKDVKLAAKKASRTMKEAAENEYPSLASVPDRPAEKVAEKTSRDRAEELKQALIADREAAAKKAEDATRISVTDSDIELPAVEAEPVEKVRLAQMAEAVDAEKDAAKEAAKAMLSAEVEDKTETMTDFAVAEKLDAKTETMTDFAVKDEVAQAVPAEQLLAVPKWTKTPVQAQAEDLFRRLDADDRTASSAASAGMLDEILARADSAELAAGAVMAETADGTQQALAMPRGAGMNARSLYRVTRTEDVVDRADSILNETASARMQAETGTDWLSQTQTAPVTADRLPLRDMDPVAFMPTAAVPPVPTSGFGSEPAQAQAQAQAQVITPRVDPALTRALAADTAHAHQLQDGDQVFVWKAGPSSDNPVTLTSATAYTAPAGFNTQVAQLQSSQLQSGQFQAAQPVIEQYVPPPVMPPMMPAVQYAPAQDMVSYRQVAPVVAAPVTSSLTPQSAYRADDMMRPHDLTQDYDSRYAELPAYRRPVRRAIHAANASPSEISDSERRQASRDVQKTAEELARMTLNINRLNRNPVAENASWQNPDVRTFD